jgi:glutathione S-transferase
MLTLYVRPGCGFCAKVLEAGEELGIDFDLKSSSDAANVAELMARGGKAQFPYLVDTERGVEMYESEDIIDYLHEHYKKDAS